MLTWSLYKTKFGAGAVVESERGLYATLLPAYSEAEVERLVKEGYGNLNRAQRPRACDRFEEYFAGNEVELDDLDLDLDGFGAFDRRVYLAAAQIPYATLKSYAALASGAGHPGAARAVGNAMRKNRLPIVIPCHRVVYAGGGIGGWSGVDGWKERLHALEGISPQGHAKACLRARGVALMNRDSAGLRQKHVEVGVGR
ncbi:MAG: methylated-DNA--[protein]-cysteine S-methyltransferase [Actinobacteria bacterium]|nr:methylated-DNA--[protein]-cysteine S-methyltransferase [Actinomycetota bacterium]